jgi:hypothetical protein|tara:strand:+ start:549 stop:860 length:312 start_codon:yes stop_codon:yes gene_type:complete
MKKGDEDYADDELTHEERLTLEESIMDAHLAADKWLSSQKEVHIKLLELSVADAMEYVELFADKIKGDPKAENYKLHMLVPLQLNMMISDKLKERKALGKKST